MFLVLTHAPNFTVIFQEIVRNSLITFYSETFLLGKFIILYSRILHLPSILFKPGEYIFYILDWQLKRMPTEIINKIITIKGCTLYEGACDANDILFLERGNSEDCRFYRQ